jgi:hypothetical protein
MEGFDFVPPHKTKEDIIEDIRSVVYEYHEASKLPPESEPEIPNPLPMLVVPDVKDEISFLSDRVTPLHGSKTIFFSTPGRRDDLSYRFLRGANSGKSQTTLEMLKFLAIGNGAHVHHMQDRTLFGEFPHPEPHYPDYPTFTWKEIYPMDTWHRLNGYHGEAKTPGERWFESGFSLKYYGFQAPAMWDHYEWLGDDTLHHTERLSTHERYKRSVLRVKIPACRYSGLNAYELSTLEYLKQPKPVDCAWWIFRFVTYTYYYQEKEEWTHSLIQAGLDAAFKVAKKPIKQRMSARPRLR